MFDSLESATESTRFSAVLCVLQLFGAPFLCLIFGLLVGQFFETLLLITSKGIRELVVGYLSFSIAGFLLGYIAQTAIPRLLHSLGQWVWIVPCCLILEDIITNLGKPREILRNFAFLHGDEGLGV